MPDARLAAEQFVSLVRGEIQLRQLLLLEAKAGEAEIHAVVEGAVDTFIRAFERQADDAGQSGPALPPRESP